MKVFTGKKGEKGFTILEVVLIVAILSIAMAIFVPGLVKLSRDLKIAELDDTAREIYASVQSRSISLSVSGRLSHVESKAAKSPPATRARDASSVTIQYVAKDGDDISGTDMLLPLGSIDEGVRQNYYIIEYNPVTAMVCSVYYWENEGNTFLTDDAAGYKVLDPANRDDRMAYKGGMVGYYGGGDVDRPEVAGASSVTVKLVNAEELYLMIMQGRDSLGPLDGTITVTLTDRDTGASKKIASFNNNKSTDIADNLSFELDAEGSFYKLTLDSLRSDLRFSMLYPEGDDGSFHPGCNLMITVTFQEEGKQAQDEILLTNSLFASVEGAPDDRTAYISYGRHLENLGLLFVYPKETSVNVSDDLNGVTKAVQTDKIDWYESLKAVGIDDPASVPAVFRPIVNETLKEFDGRGNTISHVDIFETAPAEDLLKGYPHPGSSGIGLFSRFKGDSLKNIKLVDCTIKDLTATAPQYVGLLAGAVEPGGGSCKISDCHAYAETPRADGSLDCSIDAPAANSSGGLFGSVQKVEMKNCSASLTELTAGIYVGGLAGRADAAVISSCYADTGVWSGSGWQSGLSGDTVGGLLGSMDGTLTLKDSYAVGWVSKGSTNGLAGSGSGAPVIQNCYAAVLNEAGIAGLVPAGITGMENCFNYSGSYDGFNGLLTSPGSAYTDKNEGATYAYGIPDTEIYPFPRLSNMPHYGDWPQEGTSATAMAYYEVYQEGSDYSIGFYNETINTLIDDKGLVMDGYAVLLSTADAASVPAVEYNGHPVDETAPAELKLLDAAGKFGNEIASQIGFSAAGNISVKGAAYHPLFLSSAMMAEAKNGYADRNSYYQKLKVTAGGTVVNVYFNPYVAKSDFVNVEETGDGAGSVPPTPAYSILRSSRQVTAYSYQAMQGTAIGRYAGADDSANITHTLRLERDIGCSSGKVRTDPTISGGMDCQDLSIPGGTSGAKPNVILELNGKVLTGTGKGSVVTSRDGILEVYGYTKGETGVTKGVITADMMGGSTAAMIQMDEGAKGILDHVKIDNRKNPGMSVDMKQDITLVGCTIVDDLKSGG